MSGCSRTGQNPYAESLCSLGVTARYPEEFAPRAGATVNAEDINLGNSYAVSTDASGKATLKLPTGLYRIRISDRGETDIFNGSADHVRVSGDNSIEVSLKHSKPGSIIIREIYCGGCSKAPEEGTYQLDQYLILHNNDVQVQYLDTLCLGAAQPYNSASNNAWTSKDPGTGETVFRDFVPVVEAVWQFGGSGKDFPLQPGEDAVVCLKGAIDHSARYPLSVNLNRKGYFVCYNPTYYADPNNHPTPGNNISDDHWLDVVIKTGQAKAYTYSINSPATVIWRAKGCSMREFVKNPDNIKQVPGGSERVVAVPVDWIMDGVEIFNGSIGNKRLCPQIDAGHVSLSATHLGHVLTRRTDADLTASSGFTVYADTNNSSEDFVEQETQSLHE